MNKLLIFLLIAAVLIVFLIFGNSNEEVKNPLKEVPKTVKNISSKSPVLKTDVKKRVPEKKIKTETAEKPENKNVKKREKILSEKNFNDFIYKNNLEEVQSIDENTKIYAKNFPVKNSFAPPVPPVLVKVKFKQGVKIVPLNSNLLNSNKKIYVINENGGKKVEVKEIDTKKLNSFTPPAIGQN